MPDRQLPIVAGAVFDTPFEEGCVAQSAPDQNGNFDGLDSDGVLCGFSTSMPIKVRPSADGAPPAVP